MKQEKRSSNMKTKIKLKKKKPCKVTEKVGRRLLCGIWSLISIDFTVRGADS